MAPTPPSGKDSGSVVFKGVLALLLYQGIDEAEG